MSTGAPNERAPDVSSTPPRGFCMVSSSVVPDGGDDDDVLDGDGVVDGVVGLELDGDADGAPVLDGDGLDGCTPEPGVVLGLGVELGPGIAVELGLAP